MNTQILIVNRDSNTLRQIEQTLKPLRGEWDMEFVTEGQQALEQLGEKNYSIIMTESAVAIANGEELLTKVMHDFPSVVRFILDKPLGGNANTRSVIDAHQYLALPCEVDVVKASVERTLQLRNALSGENIKDIVSQLKVLPSLPDLYIRIMDELRSTDCSLGSLGKIIEQDVGMSAKVLKLVNSAYYALPQQVSSPALAVSLLGSSIIRSMVLLFEVFGQFNRMQSNAPSFDLGELQKHCLAVGGYARSMGKTEGLLQSETDMLYMAGLFHDIGKLVLIANLPQEYNKVIESCRNEAVDMSVAEHAVLGTTHAEVGAYLLGLWGFNDSVVNACAFHHNPRGAGKNGMDSVAIIHLANAFAHAKHKSATEFFSGEIDMEYLEEYPQLRTKLDAWFDICQGIGEGEQVD